MEQSEDILMDIKEALGALTGDPHFAAAGIDAAFIGSFTRNMKHFDKLAPRTRERIRIEFRDMSAEKSYRTSVDEQWDEEKSRQMAEWFKGVNLLLTMGKMGMA